MAHLWHHRRVVPRTGKPGACSWSRSTRAGEVEELVVHWFATRGYFCISAIVAAVAVNKSRILSAPASSARELDHRPTLRPLFDSEKDFVKGIAQPFCAQRYGRRLYMCRSNAQTRPRLTVWTSSRVVPTMAFAAQGTRESQRIRAASVDVVQLPLHCP